VPTYSKSRSPTSSAHLGERLCSNISQTSCSKVSSTFCSSLRSSLAAYEHRLEVVGSALRSFFEPLHPTDLAKYQEDLIAKATVYSAGIVTLGSVQNPSEWELQRPVLDSLPLLQPLADFKTFPNLLNPAVFSIADCSVSDVAQNILPTAIQILEERWRAHFESEDLLLSEVEELWNGIPADEVGPEFRRAVEMYGWQGDLEALAAGPSAVRAFLKAVRLQELAENLISVAQLFRLSEDFVLNAAQRCKQVLSKDVGELTLVNLAGALYQLEEVAGDIGEDVRDALGELSRAETLVSFLREAEGEDLRLMIDAVEGELRAGLFSNLLAGVSIARPEYAA
jgi:hypothetical protein